MNFTNLQYGSMLLRGARLGGYTSKWREDGCPLFAGANHVLKKKQYNKVKLKEKYKKMGKILVS